MNKNTVTPIHLSKGHQQAILRKLDDLLIIKEATARRRKLREEYGPYATLKKLTPCPYCGEELSVRGLRDHLPRCLKRESSRNSQEHQKTKLNPQQLAKLQSLYSKYGDKMLHPAAEKLGIDVMTLSSILSKEPLEKAS